MGVDIYPQSAAGVPFTAVYIATKGDPIANLQEDLAADYEWTLYVIKVIRDIMYNQHLQCQRKKKESKRKSR